MEQRRALGVGLGIAGAILLLLALFACFWYLRRRKASLGRADVKCELTSWDQVAIYDHRHVHFGDAWQYVDPFDLEHGFNPVIKPYAQYLQRKERATSVPARGAPLFMPYDQMDRSMAIAIRHSEAVIGSSTVPPHESPIGSSHSPETARRQIEDNPKSQAETPEDAPSARSCANESLNTRASETSYYCKVCGRLFADVKKRDKHVRQQHSQSHPCKYEGCSKILSNKAARDRHRQAAHAYAYPPEILQCPQCPTVIRGRRDNLLKHMKKHNTS